MEIKNKVRDLYFPDCPIRNVTPYARTCRKAHALQGNRASHPRHLTEDAYPHPARPRSRRPRHSQSIRRGAATGGIRTDATRPYTNPTPQQSRIVGYGQSEGYRPRPRNLYEERRQYLRMILRLHLYRYLRYMYFHHLIFFAFCKLLFSRHIVLEGQRSISFTNRQL